jgi:hypothetical protein
MLASSVSNSFEAVSLSGWLSFICVDLGLNETDPDKMAEAPAL